MSDPRDRMDAGALWRSQGREEYDMNLKAFMERRARELHSRTRSEIIASVAAPVVFIAVVAWRFGFAHDRVVQWGAVLVVMWIVLSLYWLRRRVWPERNVPREAVAAACIDYYRHELQERRDHLRNLWLWHGPMFLACVIFLAAVLARVWPAYQQMRNVLPFVALLGVWTVIGFMQRRRQAKELQREINELDRLNPAGT